MDCQLWNELTLHGCTERSGIPTPQQRYHPAAMTSHVGRRREKQEYESLEGIIDDLSAQKLNIERELATTKDDYELMAKLSQHLEKLSELIDTKTDRWLELADLAEASHA